MTGCPSSLESTIHSKLKLRCQLRSEQDAHAIHNYNRTKEDCLPLPHQGQGSMSKLWHHAGFPSTAAHN